jgi:protein ImuB
MSTPAAARGRRIACVDVPALPLQLVLRAHPEWAADPVIVVEDDRPQARILWANRAARAARIRRGQRCQEAEALASRLHTAVVLPAELAAANGELLRLVFAFSPAVEPSPAEPGLFFADANGLHELFTGIEAWAHELHRTLARHRFVAGVAVGFTRFLTYAIARGRPQRCVVLASPDEERQLAGAVPFAALDAPPRLRGQMEALGVRTLGEFLALPVAGLARRFGKEAKELHARATAPWTPLLPVVPAAPEAFAVDFEIATVDLERVLAELAAGLDAAFARVAARRGAVTALHLELVLEHAPLRRERLAPAAPMLDREQLLELVRLRLAAVALDGPVERFTARLDTVVVTPRQLALLAEAPRRDLVAGARALARVRALLGDGAVTRARLVAAHVPEATFAWEPVRTLHPPRTDGLRGVDATRGGGGVGQTQSLVLSESNATQDISSRLVRTLLASPKPLGALPLHEPEAWLGEHGAVRRAHGPFRVANGWWSRRVDRDYFFLETDRGAVLWVFHDRLARRWYLHGRVD